jgi:hypothetical protein
VTGGGGSLRGKSAAAATLSMATNTAVAVMMIFIMLIPLCLDTRTSDRVTPQFAPSATAVELFFTAAHSSSFAEYDAARYNILNEGLRRHPGEIQSRGYHGQSQGAYGSTSPTRERFLTELTLDPPDATSDEAGVPLLDEGYLILSTIHSAKGQDWRAVFILNAIDGCIPSDPRHRQHPRVRGRAPSSLCRDDPREGSFAFDPAAAFLCSPAEEQWRPPHVHRAHPVYTRFNSRSV